MAIWKIIEREIDEDFADLPINQVYVGRIYHWWDKRNCWGREREAHNHILSFQLTEDNAENAIERSRSRGLRFCLQYFPVLVFRSPTASVLVGEINESEPLHRFLENSISVTTLQDAVDSFPSFRQNTVFKFLTDAAVPPVAAEVKFLAFETSSRGITRPLDYDRNPTWDLDSTKIKNIAKNIRIGIT